jgi:hypothetical protein
VNLSRVALSIEAMLRRSVDVPLGKLECLICSPVEGASHCRGSKLKCVSQVFESSGRRRPDNIRISLIGICENAFDGRCEVNGR